MSQILEYLFSQYSEYETIDIVLEITGVFFGLLSVIFSKMNKIWVYPTGIISTLIFAYILAKWELLGDSMINAYYFVMSIYGWYVWTRRSDDGGLTPITRTNKQEKWIATGIFFISLIFVSIVYTVYGKFDNWMSYVDTLTTAIFFSGMWLMARKKIENWTLWIIGDLISVPLYFHKGLTFSSLQYLVFTIIAIYGYLAWDKWMKQNIQTDNV